MRHFTTDSPSDWADTPTAAYRQAGIHPHNPQHDDDWTICRKDDDWLTCRHTSDQTEPTESGWAGDVPKGTEVTGVTSVSGTPGYDPTQGGTNGPLMMRDAVGSWPHEANRYSYHVMTNATTGKDEIARFDRQAPGQPQSKVATFDEPVWLAQDGTHYHAFRKARDPVKAVHAFGGDAGARSVQAASDTMRRIVGDQISPQVQQARVFDAMNEPRIHAAMNPDRRIGSGTPSNAELNQRAREYWSGKGGS